MKKVFLCFVMLVGWISTGAADPVGELKFSEIKIDENSPLLFQADRIEYDEKKGVITANGHVEIQDKQTTLLADRLQYDQRAKIIKAYGNIRIITTDNHTLFADYGELSDDLNEAFVQKVKLRMADNTRMIAYVARRRGGDKTVLRKVVFSPCPLCKKNPSHAPLWQLKSNKVIHEGKNKDIVYHHAFMEIYGVPVFYFPYMSHPDPSVKRRGGLLAPTYGRVETLGVVTGLPLFVPFGNDKDVTLKPFITSQAGYIGLLQYRQNLGAGTFYFDISGTQSKPTEKVGTVDVIQKKKTRGHINARGDFNLPRPLFADETSLGLNILRASDQTYVRRYGGVTKIVVDNQNTLPSEVYFNDKGQHTLLSARGYSFYGTRQTDNNERIPNFLPNLNFIYSSDPGQWGQYWSVETNNVFVFREAGTNTKRVSLDGAFSVPYISPFGDEYTLTASVQSDGYFIDQKTTVLPSHPDHHYRVGRVLPRVTLDWRYPFLCVQEFVTFLVEPIINFTATPDLDERKENRIPNEDSQFEFDESNVLLSDRFSGRDRVDAGRRVSAGVNFETHLPQGPKAAFFIGQSYFVSNKSTLLRESGADNHYSDYVGRLLINFSSYLDASYRFRFDRMNFRHKRGIATISGGVEKLRLSADYLFSQKDPGTQGLQKIHQVSFKASSKFHRNWSVEASTMRDLGKDPGPLSYTAGLGWRNECASLEVSYERKYFKDRDVKPGTTILMTLTLKHLGSVNTGSLTSFVDEGGPEVPEDQKKKKGRLF